MVKSLLIPLTYICLQTWLEIPQAKLQVNLSMMDDAFDDQYLRCGEKMDGIARDLIQSEMSPFSPVWENATEKWNNVKKNLALPNGFKDEYGIAIVAYTDHNPYNAILPTTFNDAVSGTNRSRAASMANFQFQAFHYYLTRALQLLWEKSGGCNVMYNMTVYRGVPVSFQHSGGNIRFGYFASSSINKEVAEGFRTKRALEKGSLFIIHTCLGVKIQNMSHNPEQEEVLIPVYEIFSVSRGQEENSFDLRSTNRTCSHFNCAYLGGKMTQTCVYNSATRGGIAFPSELSPPLFGGSVILVHVAALKLCAGF
ncbi:LOW QUALITY PROTEIN: T-cell ecto-ADP-ribosyltransferase 2-like [Mauremys reevesii]|uniref:LOW QUALITY PROTEIN: T-cell ecto-ADP-ribosyltransferase 2-like n=1 Tax=Mauremys reevesii TaxID=260615 RepID=UPI00193F06D8|nr:LOW QUALITY PROTEIN: T-cell ecto-ADP-ribosyltransferase 2-like [Mauremys reevesii]